MQPDCYICGPGPFMDLVEGVLLELGVAPEHTFLERFLVEQQEKEDAAVAAADPAGAADLPEKVTVILGSKKTVVKYQPGDTVLETARRGAGSARLSRASRATAPPAWPFLKVGTVIMRANNALTPEEVEEGWILTCQSLPSGETVTVEYEAM
jgi:3-ketosteroid 9alpha-monooxygenase subunit B